MFSETGLSEILRSISSGLKIPVMFLLVILAAFTVVLLGTLMAEIFTERRYFKVNMPAIVDKIRSGETTAQETITDGKLLKRQRNALLEITKHPELTNAMRESLAVRLIAEEQSVYDKRTNWSDMTAKLGPILGLLGTLIPLGPGIIALGQGDTYTLSNALLTAFDTTVAGLTCAAVALIISTVRKTWYDNYMSVLETLMECILEEEKSCD
jgi:Biopolymer transport proteins